MSEKYEDHMGAVIDITRRAYKRACAANMPVEFEELKQEVSLAWVKANATFDPSLGNKFSTYFYRVAYSSSFLDKLFRETAHQTIDLGITSGTIQTEDGDAQISDITASNAAEPDLELIIAENFDRFYTGLKIPDSRLAIDMLIDTPDYLELEFQAQMQKAEDKRSVGINSRGQRDLNLSFIIRFIAKLRNKGNSRAYLDRIYSEIIRSANATLKS
tara:strand:- start:104522 stop:105169 length:648 start_codon:yes stop_codon:yes gene_type:complete